MDVVEGKNGEEETRGLVLEWLAACPSRVLGPDFHQPLGTRLASSVDVE